MNERSHHRGRRRTSFVRGIKDDRTAIDWPKVLLSLGVPIFQRSAKVELVMEHQWRIAEYVRVRGIWKLCYNHRSNHHGWHDAWHRGQKKSSLSVWQRCCRLAARSAHAAMHRRAPGNKGRTLPLNVRQREEGEAAKKSFNVPSIPPYQPATEGGDWSHI